VRYVCRNPLCDDELERKRVVPLCPSCRFIGSVGLGIGSILAGVLMRIFG